jgi:large subunit ribosomal protein L7/L12
MSLSLRTARAFPALHHNNNSIRNLKEIWHSLLRSQQRCDSIATGLLHRRAPAMRNLTTSRRTMVQHGIAFSSSQTNLCRIVSANKIVLSSPSKSLFPIYESMLLSRQPTRPFHTTRGASSDAATAAATETTPPAAGASNDMPPILWTTHRLKPEQIQKVDSIFHKILWLDLFEASMLNEIVNQKMGVSLNSKQKRQLNQLMEQRAQEAVGNTASNDNGQAAEEVEAGPVLVDMKLASYDAASKIKVIKEVRSILNLGLKEAKEMVESAPVTLQKGMKQEMAEELKAKLEAVGAKIDIVGV